MITATHQLTAIQLADLAILSTECAKKDGSIPNLYIHILSQPRSLPASLLFYEQDKLIGFISAFFFYTNTVEIALIVAPDYRKKGIAKELFRTIAPLLQQHDITHLIFSAPSQLHKEWLPKRGLEYTHTEYYMERTELHPLLNYNKSLAFRTASVQDIPLLNTLDEACFPSKHDHFDDRFQHIIDDRNYHIVIAMLNNKPIGKAHLRWNEQGATLSDIAIIPSLQAQGYGTALITHCVNKALSEGKSLLNLDVEAHNQRALGLYTRLGFFIKNACDYWSIELRALVDYN